MAAREATGSADLETERVHDSAAATRSVSQSVLGGVLVLCVVVLWVAEVKVLQSVKAHTSWDKPYTVGIALKATWAIGLLPVLCLPSVRRRRRRKLQPERPASPHSLDLSWRTVRVCCALSLLVQAASITWVASLAHTSPSVNSAIYQVRAPPEIFSAAFPT
eukprot:6968893-Prymnesium_polylepis.1